MITDRINITLTAEQIASLNAAVAGVESAMPGFASLSGEQSRRLFKLGDASEAFVLKTLDALRQNPDLIPATVELQTLERDVVLREALRPIRARLLQLAERVDGAFKLAGADLMEGCSVVYRTLRIHGEGEGMEALLEDIGQRFARRRATEPTTPPPSEPTQG